MSIEREILVFYIKYFIIFAKNSLLNKFLNKNNVKNNQIRLSNQLHNIRNRNFYESGLASF